MRFLKLSVLLVAPAVFCASVPESETDVVANAIINQFLNQHGLELFFKAAERVANEAIIKHAEALKIENAPKGISELIEKIASDEPFKAAQLGLPLGGLIGGLTNTVSNITNQVTSTNPLTIPLDNTVNNPITTIANLLNTTLSNPLNATNSILPIPLDVTSDVLPIPLDATNGILPGLTDASGGILLNPETILSSPLNLTDLLNNGIFNLSNPLGPVDTLTDLATGLPVGLDNLTNTLSNLTGIPIADLGTLTSALGNLTQDVTGSLPFSTDTFNPLPFLIGGILSNLGQNAPTGLFNPLAALVSQAPIGPIAAALASGLVNIPQLISIILANTDNNPLQTILGLIALNSNGILPGIFRSYILLAAAIRAILTLVFNVLGAIGQGSPSALPPILLGVVGQLLSRGVLRIEADPLNNVDQVQSIVREIIQRAVVSDPAVMFAMSNPSQESIANAISAITQSVYQNMVTNA